MFIDEITGEQSRPLEKQFKLVVQTRPKEYYRTIKDRKTGVESTILIGRGFEIVKEIAVKRETYEAQSSPQGIIGIPDIEAQSTTTRRRKP